jgi:hypothetical protein
MYVPMWATRDERWIRFPLYRPAVVADSGKE